MNQSKCIGEPLEGLVSEWDISLTDINIKQIQSAQFQADLENGKYCLHVTNWSFNDLLVWV